MPRPSACPGLLRIVAALDGGICRVKLAGGQLGSAQARAIADAAAACASGVLELTNRSNLQIRGVRAERQGELIAALLAAGLGPRTPAADDVRNLLLSPAAGLDPAARLDVRPLAGQLLDLLQDTPAFHALSAKFALQLDGGEALAMLEHPHDLWLSAMPGGEPLLAFGLAGCPGDAPLAAVEPTQAVALVAAVLQLFLDLAGAEHSRMRQLLAELPVAEFLQRLQARLPFPLRRDQAVLGWRRPGVAAGVPLGAHAQRQAGRQMILAAAPLGRLDAAQLAGLADLAERHGAASLRLTPWQGVLLPDIPAQHSAVVLGELAVLGLLTDAAEPLGQLVACTGAAACARGLADTKADLAERYGAASLRLTPWQGVLLPDIPAQHSAVVLGELAALGLLTDAAAPLGQLVACTGAAACARGLADTKADAWRLAELLRPSGARPQVHLSGCPRSCAAAHVAPFTLLAQPGGGYQLYRRVAGQRGLGRLLAPSLSIDEAGAWLAAPSASGTFA